MSIYSANFAVGFGCAQHRGCRVEDCGEVPGIWAAKLLLWAVSRGPPGSVRRSSSFPGQGPGIPRAVSWGLSCRDVNSRDSRVEDCGEVPGTWAS